MLSKGRFTLKAKFNAICAVMQWIVAMPWLRKQHKNYPQHQHFRSLHEEN